MKILVILCAALGFAKALEITYDGFDYNGENDFQQNLAQVGFNYITDGWNSVHVLNRKQKELDVAEENLLQPRISNHMEAQYTKLPCEKVPQIATKKAKMSQKYEQR